MHTQKHYPRVAYTSSIIFDQQRKSATKHLSEILTSEPLFYSTPALPRIRFAIASVTMGGCLSKEATDLALNPTRPADANRVTRQTQTTRSEVPREQSQAREEFHDRAKLERKGWARPMSDRLDRPPGSADFRDLEP